MEGQLKNHLFIASKIKDKLYVKPINIKAMNDKRTHALFLIIITWPCP